jgi:hypothetical protein
MSYAGKDRRIHKMFVTRNTEYHVRRDQCIGVRDRRSGRWLHGHLAIKGRVEGGLRFSSEGGITPNGGLPSIGDSLFFHAAGRDLITSPVVAIERPARDVVAGYPRA